MAPPILVPVRDHTKLQKVGTNTHDEIDTGITKLAGIEAGADVTDAVNIASSIVGVVDKATPVDADSLGLIDSAATNVLKELTWANVKATLKTYFDTLYNKYVHPNHTGAVTSVADGATTITDKAVTLAKIADMATASLLGRNTTATGVPEVLSKTTALSLLNVADGANAYVHPNHSGDVTSVADGAQTISANAVTNAKSAQMATKTYKGRTTAATGNAEDVPVATVKSDLVLVKGDVGLGSVENTAHSTDAHTMTIDGRDVSVDGTKLDGIELKTISASVTRIIPAGSHGQVITAYNDKMIIEGILQVDGTFLFMDLGD